MARYTWEDIIIDPKDSRLKGAIGKECYFSDYPIALLEKANNGLSDDIHILKSICQKDKIPFIDDKYMSSWTCLILKKEEPKPEPKYVPFKNSGEFISEFEDNTPIMHVYGLWIYEKIGKFDEKVPRLVTEMWGDGVIVGSDSHTTKWKELLERFVFENNEPCGKLQEEK